MNATPQVSRAQPSSVATQLNAGSSAAASAASSGNQDFAQALNDAADGPVERGPQSGGKLPAHGKRLPPTPAAVPQPGAEVSPPMPPASRIVPSSDPASVATPGGMLGGIPGAVLGVVAGVAPNGAPGAALGVALDVTPGSSGAGAGAGAALAATNGTATAAPIAPLLPLGSDNDGTTQLLPEGAGTTPQISTLSVSPAGPAELVQPLEAAAAQTLPAASPGQKGAAAPSAASQDDAARPDGAGKLEGAARENGAAQAGAAKTATTAALNPKTADEGASPTSYKAASDNDVMAPAMMAAAIQSGTPAALPVIPDDDYAAPEDLAILDSNAKPQTVAASDLSAIPAAAATTSQPAAVAAAANAAVAAAVRTATNAHSISALLIAGAADKRTPGSGDAPSSGNLVDGAAAAAQLASNGIAANDAPPMPPLKVGAPVDSTEFGQGVAGQVSLMVDSNLTSARLQVNPPALGPIEVRIALQDGHAQVWFTSHSAVTRDALESSSPQLREMLGAQGFGQVSVDISQRSFQERPFQSQSYPAAQEPRREAAASAQSHISPVRTASGILDAYA